MRDIRFPVALALVASFALAGCVAAGGAASESIQPASSAEVRETKVAATEPEEISESVADTPVVVAATAETENPAAVPAAPSVTAARAEGSVPPSRLVTQLNEATREIATLRASNAKLKAAAAKPPAPVVIREPDPADVKLAASFRSYAQFKEELTGFFADLDKVRAENATLSAELKEASASSKEAKEALAKLESELRYEKDARNDAEQTITKLRDQLRAVADAVAAAGLSFDRAPSGGEPTARLETSRARLRAAATEAARQHVVKDGDTLETIAERYYGERAKWRLILDTNRGRLPLDGSLPAGLELEIPAK